VQVVNENTCTLNCVKATKFNNRDK